MLGMKPPFTTELDGDVVLLSDQSEPVAGLFVPDCPDGDQVALDRAALAGRLLKAYCEIRNGADKGAKC